jgi:hypothetical protein
MLAAAKPNENVKSQDCFSGARPLTLNPSPPMGAREAFRVRIDFDGEAFLA